jgi:hypothetical protein
MLWRDRRTGSHSCEPPGLTKRVAGIAASPRRRNGKRRGLLHRSRRSRTPPPRTRRRHRRRASARRGRQQEDLIPGRRRRCRLDSAAGNPNLELLGPKTPTGERPTVFTTSRRLEGHWRRGRPPAPPAEDGTPRITSLNCRWGRELLGEIGHCLTALTALKEHQFVHLLPALQGP